MAAKSKIKPLEEIPDIDSIFSKSKTLKFGPVQVILNETRKIVTVKSIPVFPKGYRSIDGEIATEKAAREAFRNLTAKRRFGAKDGSYTLEVSVKHVNEVIKAALEAKDIIEKSVHSPIGPKLVEAILGISSRERLKWNRPGRLLSTETKTFKTQWRNVECFMYDPIDIRKIAKKKLVEKWRKEDLKESSEKRKIGAKKAVKTRVENNALRKNARATLDQIAKNCAIACGSILAVPVIRLSLMTTMISRHAKAESSVLKRKYIYDLKEEALKILSKKEWAKIKYISGHEPRRKIHLCSKHFDEYCDEREIYEFYQAWQWGEDNLPVVKKCQECTVDEDTEYYSVYEINLSFGETVFTFHTPYKNGRTYLPSKDQLPKIRKRDVDEWGNVILYGRPSNEIEKISWPLKKLKEEMRRLMKILAE